ncbi:hypothetical protein DZS_35790 [Dickeya ananatis]
MTLWLAIPALLLLAVPFVTLLGITPWHHFQLAWGDGDAIAVSVGLGLLAIALVIVLGLPVALWLARASRSRRRWLVELLVMIPLLTPPLAMGDSAGLGIRAVQPYRRAVISRRARVGQ